MAKREWVRIEWSEAVPLADLKSLKQLYKLEALVGSRPLHYYGLLGATVRGDRYTGIELLYIGQPGYPLKDERDRQQRAGFRRVRAWHREHKTKRLLVMAGTVVEASLERKSQQLFDAAESCLIYDNQPLCNAAAHKKSYGGRPIDVRNTGDYEPLKRTSRGG